MRVTTIWWKNIPVDAEQMAALDMIQSRGGHLRGIDCYPPKLIWHVCYPTTDDESRT